MASGAHHVVLRDVPALAPQLAATTPFDPAYAYLFNSYYEAVGPRHPRPQRGLLSRPSVDEVANYRVHVDDAMHELIDECDAEAAALVVLGLHHEQQHQELLADGHQARACTAIRPIPSTSTRRTCRRSPTPLGYAPVHGGNTEIGHEDAGFSFDNESPRHVVHLEPIGIADRLVTARRVARVHRRRRLPPSRAVALRRLVRGAGRTVGRHRSTGATTVPMVGASSRSAAGARSTRTNPSCT